jgi:hypothetical protein
MEHLKEKVHHECGFSTGFFSFNIISEIFLVQKHVTVMEHPPYSLDLTSCDLFLFPELKHFEKVTHFDSVGHIKKCAKDHLERFRRGLGPAPLITRVAY